MGTGVPEYYIHLHQCPVKPGRDTHNKFKLLTFSDKTALIDLFMKK